MIRKYQILLLLAFPICGFTGDFTVLGDLWQIRESTPGGSYSGAIQIKNSGASAQEIKIYQTGFSCNYQGQYFFDEPSGEDPRSNAGWLSYSPKRTIIQPGEQINLDYIVAIPNNVDLKGSFWSTLMIEEIPPTSAESAQQKNSISIMQIIRYAVKIITNVGEGVRPKIRFLGAQLVKKDSRRQLMIDVENCGYVFVNPSLSLQLIDSNGSVSGKSESEKQRILPGSSVRYTVDLSSLAKGDYKAVILADCGGDDVFGIQYTIKIDE
jgi:hypothetical protein